MSETLIDVAREYREAFERLNDMELPDEVVADTLEGLAGPLEERATNLIGYAARLEALAGVLKEREAAIAARRKAMEARAERINQFVMNAMKLAQIKLIETPEWKLRVKKSSPKLIVDAPGLVPAEFMRFPDPPPPEIDKKLALQKIAAGEELNWCHAEQGEYLDIR